MGKAFDKNWDYGKTTCGRCKAIFWVEGGTGKRVSLLFKDRCKGMCNDCIEEVRPTKTLKVRKSYLVWFATIIELVFFFFATPYPSHQQHHCSE